MDFSYLFRCLEQIGAAPFRPFRPEPTGSVNVVLDGMTPTQFNALVQEPGGFKTVETVGRPPIYRAMKHSESKMFLGYIYIYLLSYLIIWRYYDILKYIKLL